MLALNESSQQSHFSVKIFSKCALLTQIGVSLLALPIILTVGLVEAAIRDCTRTGGLGALGKQ